MALDETSAQLHTELRQAVQSSLASRRPLLHHLNTNSSWLLQIPRPDSAVRNGGRFYYNILVDPLLRDGRSNLAFWFSQQRHVTPSAVTSIATLEELARELEILASGLRLGYGRKSNTAIWEEGGGRIQSFIDAVVISHHFADYCHKETLYEVHPDVPVFAVHKAAKLVESWQRFRTVITVEVFEQDECYDWRSTSMPPLPDWIGINTLVQKEDVPNYHSALIIAFNNMNGNVLTKLAKTNAHVQGRGRHHAPIEPNEDDESAEAIVYAPRGVNCADLAPISNASPTVQTLAFLHGLHGIRVAVTSVRTALQSKSDAYSGLKAQKILNAKYWVSMHDEVKRGGGLVTWFLRTDVVTLKDAVEQEQKAKKQGQINGELGEVLDSFEGTNWVDMANGESILLI